MTRHYDWKCKHRWKKLCPSSCWDGKDFLCEECKYCIWCERPPDKPPKYTDHYNGSSLTKCYNCIHGLYLTKNGIPFYNCTNEKVKGDKMKPVDYDCPKGTKK